MGLEDRIIKHRESLIIRSKDILLAKSIIIKETKLDGTVAFVKSVTCSVTPVSN